MLNTMNCLVWMTAVAALTPAQPILSVQTYGAFVATIPGDAARGKEVFQRASVGCAGCHTIGKGSLKAGPDLLGIGDKYSRAQLARAVLEPSAFILTGYAATTVVTESGQLHSGIIARRDPEQIELLLATNQRTRIRSDRVAEEQRSAVSLMPTGVNQLLTPQELADLISYLASLKQLIPPANAGRAIPQDIPRVDRPVQFEPFHSEEIHFQRPIWFDAVPGAANRFVVAQHNPPEIWMLEKREDGDKKTLFLSLKDEAIAGNDTGILGMAFHPDFLANRKYYVYHHVREQGSQGAVLVERLAAKDFLRDSGTPSRRLVHVERWTVAHTGGVLVFGPDGFLYVGVGDGGPQEDPEGNAQNRRLLLGSILRIDVNGRSPQLPYGIPASNPFFGHSDPLVRQEIWALGFRQPWRLSFDPVTHDLWVGDVGQNKYEEVAIVRGGENHGWNVYEGHVRFSDKYRQAGHDYVEPVVSILRKYGVSVTGGHVYRGHKNESYDGVYVFGDFESKRVWGVTQDHRQLDTIREIGTSPDRIVSFGIDANGELYVVGYDTGKIYRIQLEDSAFE